MLDFCIGKKAVNCVAVVRAFFSRNLCLLRKYNSKHASVISRFVVCLFVFGNVTLKATASPMDVRTVFFDGGQVLLVKPESDLSNRAVGVFSEVEKNVVEGESVGGNGGVVLVNGVVGPDPDRNHSDSACDSKQEFCIGRDEANDIHDGLKAFATGMWIGLVLLFIYSLGKSNVDDDRQTAPVAKQPSDAVCPRRSTC
jgi:hypothetical protein